MELLKPLQFTAERLIGGAWAALADLALSTTVEAPAEPVMAAMHYYPKASENEA